MLPQHPVLMSSEHTLCIVITDLHVCLLHVTVIYLYFYVKHLAQGLAYIQLVW